MLEPALSDEFEILPLFDECGQPTVVRDCPMCDRSGFYEEGPCPNCDGTGTAVIPF
jgi:hypothetical protein